MFRHLFCKPIPESMPATASLIMPTPAPLLNPSEAASPTHPIIQHIAHVATQTLPACARANAAPLIPSFQALARLGVPLPPGLRELLQGAGAAGADGQRELDRLARLQEGGRGSKEKRSLEKKKRKRSSSSSKKRRKSEDREKEKRRSKDKEKRRKGKEKERERDRDTGRARDGNQRTGR